VSANVETAQAVEPSTPVAPTTTVQTPWRERASSELEKIVQLFSSKQLPDLCAKALINAPGRPSSKWSFGNQLLMLLAGTNDARGFRQWNETGRFVSKGAKAFWILGPVRKKVKAGKQVLEGQGEPQEGVREILIGFKAIPVFRYEDTNGQDLPVYEPKTPPPLLEVAERFGMEVLHRQLCPVQQFPASRQALHESPRQNQESPRPDLHTQLSPIADMIHIRLSSFFG
jgi:hypothetical protein